MTIVDGLCGQNISKDEESILQIQKGSGGLAVLGTTSTGHSCNASEDTRHQYCVAPERFWLYDADPGVHQCFTYMPKTWPRFSL